MCMRDKHRSTFKVAQALPDQHRFEQELVVAELELHQHPPERIWMDE